MTWPHHKTDQYVAETTIQQSSEENQSDAKGCWQSMNVWCQRKQEDLSTWWGHKLQVLQKKDDSNSTQQVSNSDISNPDALMEVELVQFQPFWSVRTVVVAAFALLVIWALGWLYLGFSWNPLTRLHNLHVAVLNCDAGIPSGVSINPNYTAILPQLLPVPLASSLLSATVFNSSSPASRSLHWNNFSCPGTEQNGSPGCGKLERECALALQSSILQGDFWAALYFPGNFSLTYLSWFPPLEVQPAAQPSIVNYIIGRGRDYSTYNFLSTVIVQRLIPSISQQLAASVLARTASTPGLLNPGFLISPVRLQEQDLLPVKNFGQHFASYIICVLMWLGASFAINVSYQFKMPLEIHALDAGKRPEPPKLRELILAITIKGFMSVCFMLVLATLCMALLVALGQGNEQWYYSKGYCVAFAWYLSWSFLGVNAVLLHTLGVERFTSISAFLLVLQLTSASAVFSLDLSNRFFYIGKGLPFYYGVRGLRTIFFGSLTNKMGINWLVISVYNLVFGPLSVLLVARTIRRLGKQARLAVAGGIGGNALVGVAAV